MEVVQQVWSSAYALLASLFAVVYWALHGLIFGHPCETNGCGCERYDDGATFKKLSIQSRDPMYAKLALDSGAVGAPMKCDGCGCDRGAHARLDTRKLEAEYMPNGGAVLYEQSIRQAAARRAARFSPAITYKPKDVPKTTWEDAKEGDGDLVESGTEILCKYAARFASDEKQFEKNGEYRFKVGAMQVIPGFDEGVRGMRAGGTRVITIPPTFAYGSTKSVDGRVGETLVFTVTLLAACGP